MPVKHIFLTILNSVSMFSLFGQNKSEKEFKNISGKRFPVIKVQAVQNEADPVLKMSGENEQQLQLR